MASPRAQSRRAAPKGVEKQALPRGADVGALGEALQGFLADVLEPPRDDSGLNGKRVLLVDDDIRNIYAMTELLEEIGLTVIPAKDGEEALEVFGREPCDLVLMDIRMPGIDGIEATRRLAGVCDVLVLTTFDLDDLVDAALDAVARALETA